MVREPFANENANVQMPYFQQLNFFRSRTKSSRELVNNLQTISTTSTYSQQHTDKSCYFEGM